ncbi:formate hydrogenlyase [Vulcanimicrobium alpinum]|uniref:Formate hydrogenlyase n=1 Tax=Vulcanimicrobium alpinum TaxID=3016050 RepID=A0AAN1XZK3_UNVUL|nr:NADH-quinone oxidoreductase subunit H [Vulcanimicrobium alpinum]BDE08239.1 formate hydrogenlyase [Vulcanimicrobium alpinum]
MTATLPAPLVQIFQVAAALFLSPLLTGVIARWEALVAGKRGPSVLQTYRDIVKFLRKASIRPDVASPVFRYAPYVVCGSYATIATLIPVLTTYPLPGATYGDILAGAFLFALGSFATSLAALDSGSQYANIGASRATMVGIFVEPTLIFVFFSVAFISGTDLPYAMNAQLRDSLANVLRPAHVLATAAFFLMLLVDTGRIPIESSSATTEFGMIDDARLFEHTGPEMALFKWAGSIKQFLLYTIFINVLLIPQGLSTDGSVTSVAFALVTLFLKMLLVGALVTIIDTTFAKLRLYRVVEFIATGLLVALLAVVAYVAGFG